MRNISFKNIDLEILEKIQGQLKKQDNLLFDQEIGSKFKAAIPKYIKETDPRLQNEASEITYNLSRRLKNLIRKYDLKSGVLNIEKYFNDFLKHECELAIPSKLNKNNNLGLTKVEFKKLKVSLKTGDETLIEKMYLQHFKICLAYLIKSTNCNYEEAYESTIDALYEIRKDLLQDKIMYGNLASYFNHRAKLVFLAKKRKNTLHVTSLENEVYLIEDSLYSETEKDEQAKLVNIAITNLGEECKNLIRLFYYEGKKLKEIAIDAKKTDVAIRKQISRCRDTMRTYLSKALYDQTLN